MSRASVVIGLSLLLSVLAGCEAEQCKQMRACCAAISGEEWVGDSCGAVVANIHDPQSCSAIMSAIEAAGQGKAKKLPAACTP